jgi:hypothetical protein
MQLKVFDMNISDKISQLPAPSQLRSIYHGSVASMQSDALLEASSHIISIVPDEDRQPIINFVSKYTTECHRKAFLKNKDEDTWEYFDLFWSIPQSRSSAGWMWEGRVINEELQGGTTRSRDLRRLEPADDGSTRPLKKQRPISERLDLPIARSFTHWDVESLSNLISILSSLENLYFLCLAR